MKKLLSALTMLSVWGAINSNAITASDHPGTSEMWVSAEGASFCPLGIGSADSTAGIDSRVAEAYSVRIYQIRVPYYSYEAFGAAAAAAEKTILDGGIMPPVDWWIWSNFYFDETAQSNQVVGFLIDAQSLSGGDDLSLDQLRIRFESVDGLLNGTMTFGSTASYTPLAPLIKADGSRTLSGPSNQKGNRIILVAFSKEFPVTNSAEKQRVKDWIGMFEAAEGSYWLRCAAQVGDNSTESTTTVGTQTSPYTSFKVSVRQEGGQMTIAAANPDPSRTYHVLGAPTVNGPWAPVGMVVGTNSVVVPTGQQTAFYRGFAQ